MTPIRLSWEENGLHVEIDVDELRGCVLELDGSTLRGVMHTGQAWDLYEHVQQTLGDWYREGAIVRGQVLQYAGEDELLDPLDPKHPGYAEGLRELGDIARKREREA